MARQHVEGQTTCASTRCPTPAESRHVIILNWRDITHPRAGGAEKVTHEIARRWIAWGHKVTLFCASYAGAQSEDTIDGVSVIRRGRQQTVHWEAYRHYRCLFRGRCDVIIDEVNTIPFFTPLYVSEPVIMYSNQLAREVWRYEAPFPLSTLGYMAESLYLRAYCRTPIMTISRSTENDLRALGLPGPYHIIPMSINTKAPMVLPPLETKETHLTLVFVGRVVPSKRVDHMVQALALIHQAGLRQAHLWIIGAWNDEYRCKLNNQIVNLGLGGHVTFWGRVDDVTKERLLGAAHIFVMTSVREGWGLVVTEANALGTPAIVYNVPGLRDSTRHGETGLVCRSNNPLALAHTIMSLRQDSELYMRLRHCAWATAKRLSWDQTARAAWDVVEACL